MGLTDLTALEGAHNKALDHSGSAPVLVEPRSEPEVLPAAAMRQQEASPRKDLIAVAAVMLLLVTFALGHISASRKSVAYPDQLRLSAELHDSIVEVKWNPESPAVRDSERGALEIITGTGVNRIELSQAQLRAGQFYVYTAVQTDLKCFFSLYRNQNVFVGATQNVHLSLPQTETEEVASLPEQQPTDPPPATVEPPIAKPSPAQRNSKDTSRTKKSLLDRVKQANDRALARSRGVSFTPPPVVSTLVPVPRTEDPPTLGESESSTAGLFPGLPSVASAFEAPLTFSAVPIKRVNPTLPRDASVVISQEISIRVAVEIDREGRVKDARPLNDKDPTVNDKDATEKLLATNAVKAARRWRFNPAHRDGMPVPSETVLVFQFAKTAKTL
jgi:hypothetical protein